MDETSWKTVDRICTAWIHRAEALGCIIGHQTSERAGHAIAFIYLGWLHEQVAELIGLLWDFFADRSHL
jgi:hypothetical protein